MRVVCKILSKNNAQITIIIVTQINNIGINQSLADGRAVADVEYSQYLDPLFRQGWSQVLESSVEIPDDCELKAGVYQADDRMTVTEWVSQHSCYNWDYIRRKNPSESIGFGKLPGHIGQWKRKL